MKLKSTFSLLLIFGIISGSEFTSATTSNDNTAWNEIEPILDEISASARYNEPPSLSSAPGVPDGPLLGNGDLAVLSAGTFNKQVFHISKSDLSHNISYVGNLTLYFVTGLEERNLAEGAIATASSYADFGKAGSFPPSMVVDGTLDENTTREWATDAGDENAIHWLMLDLNDKKTIGQIHLYHDAALRPEQNKETVNTNQFKVQYWDDTNPPKGSEPDDGKGWKTIKEYADNTDNINRIILDKPLKTRYLRLYITRPGKHSCDRARIHEILLYGSSRDLTPNIDTTLYSQIQNIKKAQVESTLPISQGQIIHTCSWTADNGNYLVTRVSNKSQKPQEIILSLNAMDNARPTKAGLDYNGDIAWVSRTVDETVTVATKIIGAKVDNSVSDGSNQSSFTFTVPATKDIYVVSSIGGGKFSKMSGKEVMSQLGRVKSPADLKKMYEYHLAWWKNYWLKSYILLDDELDYINRFYYGALYVWGSGSRKGGAGMSICGPWRIGDHDLWGNNYTTNYNFESPWWGVHSSNRSEHAIPYYEAALRAIPAAIEYAKHKELPGGLFKTQIDQWYNLNYDWQQKSNGVYILANFIWHYYMNYDDDFLVNTAWPLLNLMAEFWEGEKNLKFNNETKRYEVLNSAAREITSDGGIAPDKNSSVDLALVKQLFTFLTNDAVIKGLHDGGIKLSDDRIKGWRYRSENLADISTVKFEGKTVFSESETLANEGRMCLTGPGDNPCVLDSVFPGNFLSLGSHPDLLQTARNTLEALNSAGTPTWHQGNSFPRIFTQAARIGYDGETILKNLTSRLDGSVPKSPGVWGITENFRHNLTINPHGHGVESIGATEAINSMLMQSHDEVIRFFPVWPKERKAKFVNLRAYGAFLVSAEYDPKQQEILAASLTSEKGLPAIIQSPWREKLKVTDNEGNPVETQKVKEKNTNSILYRFNTKKGETYRLLKE